MCMEGRGGIGALLSEWGKGCDGLGLNVWMDCERGAGASFA
jgi:hypothetical protein